MANKQVLTQELEWKIRKRFSTPFFTINDYECKEVANSVPFAMYF